MLSKAIFLCVLILLSQTQGRLVKRDNKDSGLPNPMNMGEMMAGALNDVQEKQIQPLFNLFGEGLGRFSKALKALGAPSSSS